MKAIAVTGTPGTGKTRLARFLSRKFGFKLIDVNNLIARKRLSEGYDRKRKTRIVDTRKLNRELIKIIGASKRRLIIDSHLSHFLPPKCISLCIITRCDIMELRKRLQRRGYPKEKIRENLECEIFRVCLDEALEIGHRPLIVNTQSRKDMQHALRRISLYNKK